MRDSTSTDSQLDDAMAAATFIRSSVFPRGKFTAAPLPTWQLCSYARLLRLKQRFEFIQARLRTPRRSLVTCHVDHHVELQLLPDVYFRRIQEALPPGAPS
jgi:hypothetical protein